MNEATIKELIKKALQAREGAYAPYSSFSVGAAILFDSGKIYTGANCENASYTAGICAERVALFSAIACGERKPLAVAVVGGKENSLSVHIITPCGICRQALCEHGAEDTLIICAKSAEEYTVYTLGELLPGAFTKESL